MKRSLPLLIALAYLILSSTPVFGCSCAEYDVPISAEYWRSDAVFVGRLRDITPWEKQPADDLPMATFHFIVEQPFRGITTATVDIQATFGTMCDLKFVKGKSYLIYADLESNQLFTGFCSRTKDVRYAQDDLSYIRSLVQQGVKESIAGLVERMRYQPMSSVKVEVRNENKSIEGTVAEDGNFSVPLAGPGMYTVRLLVPSSVLARTAGDEGPLKVETTDGLTTIEYKVELEKGGCDYRQFDIWPVNLHATAEVSGVVLTASGRAIDKGYVYLQKGDEYSKDSKIEADGSFKFTGIAAGEYFLVLNPKDKAPGEDDPPYARTFYPNAKDESSATKIVVAEGAKLENLTLRVGPALKARTVSGRVVWKNGTPGTDEVAVSLYNDKVYVRRGNTDSKGFFSLQVYGDFKYAIEAQVWSEGRDGKSDRVPITEKSTNLKLVLKPE